MSNPEVRDTFARWAIGLLCATQGFVAMRVWSLPQESPPAWFVRQVDAMSGNIQTIQADMSRLTVNMATVSSNRFSAQDGVEVWRELAELQRQVNELRNWTNAEDRKGQ